MQFYDDVYIGRDNYIVRRVKTVDNVPVDIGGLTRCTLELVSSDPPYVIDSSDYSHVFDWETYSRQGFLGLRLGLVQGLPTGFLTFKLVIYSDEFTQGLDNLKPIYFRVWPLSNG